MIVVIPTNRNVNLDYLEPLIDAGARFVVVDDTEGSVRIDHPQFEVFAWPDRQRILGDCEIAIPRRNGACRDLGFYGAWRETDENEIIVALDDDCAVYNPDFASQVERNLGLRPRALAQCKGPHLNILELYEGVPDNLFPRGFPYSARAGHGRAVLNGTIFAEAKFVLGLWRGIFDVNAIDKLEGPAYAYPNAVLKHDSVLVPAGKLVSVCSMNMQFRREVLPAVYQLPMHVPVLPHWVIDRYGDIWGGFILKTLMDIRGDAMVVGEPMIHHLKEGNFHRNIWQEHVCHLVNDEFIALLGEGATRIASADYVSMMEALNEEFRRSTERCSPLLKPYMEHLTRALAAWVRPPAGLALFVCGTPPQSLHMPALGLLVHAFSFCCF